jgi:hypothetical protein
LVIDFEFDVGDNISDKSILLTLMDEVLFLFIFCEKLIINNIFN